MIVLAGARPEEGSALRRSQCSVCSAARREMLEQGLHGRTSKETAAALGIGVRTVEGHRRWILQRIGVASPTELMAHLLDFKS